MLCSSVIVLFPHFCKTSMKTPISQTKSCMFCSFTCHVNKVFEHLNVCVFLTLVYIHSRKLKITHKGITATIASSKSTELYEYGKSVQHSQIAYQAEVIFSSSHLLLQYSRTNRDCSCTGPSWWSLKQSKSEENMSVNTIRFIVENNPNSILQVWSQWSCLTASQLLRHLINFSYFL